MENTSRLEVEPMGSNEIEINRVRDGSKYDAAYINTEDKLDDFSLLTIDVADKLCVRRENVQRYVLPQLDFVQADIRLKVQNDSIRAKNLISKKSVNEYIGLFLKNKERRIAIKLDKVTYKKIFKERLENLKFNKLQLYLEESSEIFNELCESLNPKEHFKFSEEGDFINNINLWSNGALLNEVFDYNQQILRALKRVHHVKFKIPLIKSRTPLKSEHSVKYYFPNGEGISELRGKLSAKGHLFISLKERTYHYINEIMFEKYGVYRCEPAECENNKEDIYFKQILINELIPLIQSHIDEEL